ncbi:galactokinase [Gracilimonas mengyeensis]|uniref:Galactokinase n=1 Tax=Gracilimonas mengyeensis TaxID=1302730 RepID=A0A521BS72_9BACT|nr:galactokinase [Gracilimonas mengyeensis]SMO50026.1 galactokinase [Gracilimonas mengyeensis]
MTDLIKKIKSRFKERFNEEPVLIQSPGRVNLIGEHTDYNDGFVLPAAIQKVILLGIAKNGIGKIRAYSEDMDEAVELDLNNLQKSDKHWANYIKGAVSEVMKAGHKPKGFDVVFGGDIPIGAGLSSSAALEGAVLVGLEKLFSLGLDRKRMAKIGQLTEHNHVGVNCGIMDQFINLHGEANKVLKLDCRSLEYELYPFIRDDIKIVLCDSKVSHNLADSEYNVRRSQCEEGVEVMKNYKPEIKNLRDVDLELLNAHKDEMEEVVYRRCKYVLEENERVHAACRDLENNDFEAFGKRMFASHDGLSNDYEVSCEELDVLVDIAKNQPGLLGARMMGGGFGGCTINLVEEQHVEAFTDAIKEQYKARTGKDTEIYITQINGGTQVLQGDEADIKK